MRKKRENEVCRMHVWPTIQHNLPDACKSALTEISKDCLQNHVESISCKLILYLVNWPLSLAMYTSLTWIRGTENTKNRIWYGMVW